MQDKTYIGRKPKGKVIGEAMPMPLPLPNTFSALGIPNPFALPGSSVVVPIYFGKKRYELTDWLGNVRVVVSDKKIPVNTGTTTVGYKPEVTSVSDYYSFGSEINERTYTQNTPYRFSFNGKEDIHEQHFMQDYGARWYNKALGRFISPDPLIVGQKKYAWLSAYQFASNSPVWGVDKDGLELETKIYMYEEWDKAIAKLKNQDYEDVHLKNQMTIGKHVLEQAVYELAGYGIGRALGWLGKAGWKYISSATGKGVAFEGEGVKWYRYVGEEEAKVIKETGEIPNVGIRGESKKIYITNRYYKTAGRAQTHLQLEKKPSYRVEIDPKNVKNPTPFKKIKPEDNPLYGKGGGTEATTTEPIKVDPSKIEKLKGAPKH